MIFILYKYKYLYLREHQCHHKNLHHNFIQKLCAINFLLLHIPTRSTLLPSLDWAFHLHLFKSHPFQLSQRGTFSFLPKHSKFSLWLTGGSETREEIKFLLHKSFTSSLPVMLKMEIRRKKENAFVYRAVRAGSCTLWRSANMNVLLMLPNVCERGVLRRDLPVTTPCAFRSANPHRARSRPLHGKRNRSQFGGDQIFKLSKSDRQDVRSHIQQKKKMSS